MKIISKIVNYVIGLAQKTGGEVSQGAMPSEQFKEAVRRLAAEGAVLLKNEGVLPLSESVSVFGRVQRDWFYVGYGSGGDVKPPYRVNLIDGLKNDGIAYDESLAEQYEQWCTENVPDNGFWGHWPLNYPEMPLSAEQVASARKKTALAVVVVGRAAGEDRDQKLCEGGFYITKSELKMLDSVSACFERIVLIVNNGNIMDLSWIEKYPQIKAVLYAWQGGMESGNAVADVLCGKVNPCAKMPATVAKCYADYPTAGNFGNKKYNAYEEDIYVGYRYFDLFRADRVLYPFGYGLSYTQFQIQTESFGFDGDSVKLNVSVKNVGKLAGKEVLQVYASAPQGRLGKPAKVLIAFEKTKLLAVGEIQRFEFAVPVSAFASYDDFGYTGHRSCYVAESGEYVVLIGGNPHELNHSGSFMLDSDKIWQCQEICPVPKNKGFRVTYPEFQNGKYTVGKRAVATRTSELATRINANAPKEIATNLDSKPDFCEVTSGRLTIEEFVATLPDDELEELLRGDLRMDSSLGSKGNAGAIGGVTERLRARGIPAVITTDGPSGIRLLSRASLLPCGTAIASSFNTELTKRVYSFEAEEMKKLGSDLLLGPGMNLLRDPLCGRNFEYYSEDPLLAGKMAAAFVGGVQSGDVGACIKHFACNNQEYNRKFNDSGVSERALRELYLKGFEICVREQPPYAVMNSYNRINGIYSCLNYDLNTTVLRGEWGYDGLVMTDWWTKLEDGEGLPTNAYRVRSQCDVLMPGGDAWKARYDCAAQRAVQEGLLSRAELQRSAINVLKLVKKYN